MAESVDAIVVLGARIEADGSPGAALARRLTSATNVFERGLAPTILVSGGARWHGHIEAIAMRRFLIELGVPDDAVLIEPLARSTAENAFFCARVARSQGWRSLAVVSCPWHLPRALRNFERCGIPAVPIAAEAGPANRGHTILRDAKERTCTFLDAIRLSSRFPW